LYGSILAPLRQVIVDNCSVDTEDEKLLRAMFVVEQSSMRQEHTTFKNHLTIYAEMLEDAKTGSAAHKAKGLFAQFGEAYVRTKCEFATKALTNYNSPTFKFNGKTFDRTTGDGQPVFSHQHKCKNTGSTNHSNIFTNAFGSDASMLNKLANIGRNLKNETGNITRYLFDTLIIPGNTPVLEDMAKRVIASEHYPGGDKNDINTQFGKWKLIVNPYWTVADGELPYIIMSSKALEQTSGNIFYNRTKLMVKEDVDNDWNLVISARARFSCGFYDWRHMVMGGAPAGTTLS
ncbi:MAG: hypothetical protein WCS45_06260, partial [Clostridia bacterium]